VAWQSSLPGGGGMLVEAPIFAQTLKNLTDAKVR